MRKLNVCVLFGGVSPEHEVSLRSAESVLNNMDRGNIMFTLLELPKQGSGFCMAEQIMPACLPVHG